MKKQELDEIIQDQIQLLDLIQEALDASSLTVMTGIDLAILETVNYEIHKKQMEADNPTLKQLEFLRKLGFDFNSLGFPHSKQEASETIERMKNKKGGI